MKGKKVSPEVREAATVLSRLGASKGGRSRAASLTPERRREIARKAISSRWNRGRKTTNKARAIVPPFDPIEIPGPPLSETVIQERR